MIQQAMARASSKKIENASEKKGAFFERLIRSSNKIVRSTHPTVQEVNRITKETFGRSNPQVQVVVDREKNAYVLPHGAVFLNTGLLDLIESEEQLRFVIGHELSHLDQRKKVLDESKTHTEYMAGLRLEEYVGDLSAFLKLNQDGRNPEEGIKLLKKLGYAKHGDMVHGDAIHRVLNLHWMTRLMDLKGFEATPTPISLSTVVSLDDLITNTPDVTIISNPNSRDSAANREIKKCDFFGAIAAYQALIQEKSAFFGPLEESFHARRYDLFDIIEQKVAEIQTPEGDAGALADLIRVFCCGDASPNPGWARPSVEDYIAVMSSEEFDKFGVFPVYREIATPFVGGLEDEFPTQRTRRTFQQKLGKLLQGLPAATEGEFEVQRALERGHTALAQLEDIKYFEEQIKGLSPQEAVRQLLTLKRAMMVAAQAHEPPRLSIVSEGDERISDLVEEVFLNNYAGAEIPNEIAAAYRVLDLFTNPLGRSVFGIGGIRTLDEFSSYIEVITKNSFARERYPGLAVSAVTGKDRVISDARSRLLTNNVNNPEFRTILRESLAMWPSSYVGELDEVASREIEQIEGTDRESLEFVYNLSLFLSLDLKKDEVQSRVLPQLWDTMNFDEAYQFLKQNIRRITSPKSIEILVEEKAQTNEDMERLMEFKDEIGKLSISHERFGEVMYLEAMQRGYCQDRLGMLEAALETQYDDGSLGRLIDQEFRSAKKRLQEVYAARRLSDEVSGVTAWETAILDGEMKEVVKYTKEQLYAMGLKHKYAFLRLALADPIHGALTNEESRGQVATRLMNSLVERNGTHEQAWETVETVLGSLIDNAPLQLSYFALVPMLIDNIFIGPNQEERAREKRSLVDFVCECAKNLGSPGVRFLQLFGQYVTLPQEYEGEFQKVYDSLRGQSKLTAYQTVKREYPEFRDEYSGLERAIGGGSLSTVYLARTKEGEQRVVKVLNPNLGHLNDIAFDVVKEALGDVAQKDRKYEIGEGIVDEIREWVEGDINFAGFLEKDAEFREQNHGFEGPREYTMHVPRSFGPDNKHFKIEEFVDGTNLTQLETLASQGHDVKAIVATIAQNYLHQMQQGKLHSDVHQGNFRITQDREIAILDRNFYLELTEKQRESYVSLVGYAMAKDVEGIASTLAENLGLGRNSQAISGLYEAVQGELSSDRSVTDQMLGVVKHLKSNNVKLPIETTLLIRNLHSLQKFSESAGFSSLGEALMYS